MSGSDLRDTIVDVALSTQCPHCGARADDSFEALDNETIVVLRCEACRKPFHQLVFECSHCTEENVITWLGRPTAEQVAAARCSVCDTRFRCDDDDGRLQDQLLE